MRPVELRIERLSKSGDGVASHEGRAVFVSGALPGELVLARLDDGGAVRRAELLRVLEASPARRTPPCPIAGECGGCDWMHVADDAQLAAKEAIVVSTLEHVGGLAPDAYLRSPPIRAPAPLGYRRRATLHPVGGRLGFFGRRSHTRVPVDECMALTPPLAKLPGVLSEALGPVLKDVEEVRLLEGEGRVAISVHLKGGAKPRHRAALEALLGGGVIDGAVLASGAKEPVTLVGAPVLEVDGVAMRPDAFAQTHEAVNRALVRRAVEWLELSGRERVLELYSGNGNFTFAVAAQAASVLAVESAAVSVRLAQAGAARQGGGRVRLVQGDSATIAFGLVKEAQRFDRLLVDPPRAGAPGVERWASGLLVSRVVYVACDPASLARDAAALASRGFRPLALQVADMFPQTHHVEAVMLFGRD